MRLWPRPPDQPYPLPMPTRGRPKDWRLARHQSETLDGVVSGATSPEMSAHLRFSVDTMKTRLARLFDASGHRTRHGLATWAYVEGIYVPDLLARREALEDVLTTMRYRVLAEALTGRDHLQVAQALSISVDTVKTHVRKLGESWDMPGGIPVLVPLALRAGLFDLSELRAA